MAPEVLHGARDRDDRRRSNPRVFCIRQRGRVVPNATQPHEAVSQVASGNMLEMYDFMVFGYYAADIGRAFFPSGNAQAELMLSFATFGAGFLMRPLGALVLGAYIDRIGRRQG